MTAPKSQSHAADTGSPGKAALWFFVALLCAAQWIVIHFLHTPLSSPWEAILPGLGIFGAAFLLSWGAELSQLEISQALALAFLALMAVLPEYAVDMYLAWKAAKDPVYIHYAAANMTGANRILIGFGWPVVLLCYWLATKKKEIVVDRGSRIELFTLTAATLYAFVIPLKRSLTLFDMVILVGLFVVYIVQSSRAEHVEPELEGPPAHIATWPRAWRRVMTLALFILPGLAIFTAAEPFAEGLLHMARGWGVEEFLLIQWLAPLASEAPEFIVATLFALRGNAQASLGTLVSSKVNQWTLLIGMLPLVYSISGGGPAAMHLDGRQAEEIFLTAAQSLLAVIILANWSFGLWEGVLLLSMFFGQWIIPAIIPGASGEQLVWIRVAFGVAYLLVSAAYLFNPEYRRSIKDLLRKGWSVSPTEK